MIKDKLVEKLINERLNSVNESLQPIYNNVQEILYLKFKELGFGVYGKDVSQDKKIEIGEFKNSPQFMKDIEKSTFLDRPYAIYRLQQDMTRPAIELIIYMGSKDGVKLRYVYLYSDKKWVLNNI